MSLAFKQDPDPGIEHLFGPMLPPSDLCQRIRMDIKTAAKAADVAWLLRWILTHFSDDGKLRSPQMQRRKSIVLDGIKYLLVRNDRDEI